MSDSTDFSGGITMEMYFRLKGQTFLPTHQTVQILFMKRAATSSGFFMAIGNGTGSNLPYSRLMIDIGGSGSNRVSYPGDDAPQIPENVDIYIAYTFTVTNSTTGTGIGRLYINGVLYASYNKGNAHAIANGQTGVSSLHSPINIGIDIAATVGSPNQTYPFFGTIYASRIYDRPLSSGEVVFNYENTTGKSVTP